MKTLHLTNKQHELLVAALDAIQGGTDAREAVQRTMERFEDVQPVGEGSEEEGIIWGLVHDVFDKVRAAPDRIYTQTDIEILWTRYFDIVPVGHEGPLTNDQWTRLLALIREAPLHRKKDGKGFTEGYWIYKGYGRPERAVGISYHASGEACMCDEDIDDVRSRV